jgi:RecA/RadA recombinase
MVDNIIALHRAEFTGRITLAERQQRLNIMLHKLSRLAEVYNIAVVVTNQVQSQPDDFSGRYTLQRRHLRSIKKKSENGHCRNPVHESTRCSTGSKFHKRLYDNYLTKYLKALPTNLN